MQGTATDHGQDSVLEGLQKLPPPGHNDSEQRSTPFRLLAFQFLVGSRRLDCFPLEQSFSLSYQAQAVEQSRQIDGHGSHLTPKEHLGTSPNVKFFCLGNATDS